MPRGMTLPASCQRTKALLQSERNRSTHTLFRSNSPLKAVNIKRVTNHHLRDISHRHSAGSCAALGPIVGMPVENSIGTYLINRLG